MARVFISYAREDKPVVQALVVGLNAAGHKVWSDAQLHAGDNFRDVIEAELAIADVVVVVWSKRAEASRYVLDEAEKAVSRGVLLPVRLDGTVPLGYGTLHALDFQSWGGNYESDSWRTLLNEVARIAKEPNPPRRRIALQVIRQASLLAASFGLVIGLTLWRLYPSTQGYPILASVVLGMIVSTPIAVVSALETRRSGFEELSLIAWRCVRWFLYGGCFALVIITLLEAKEMVAVNSPDKFGEIVRACFTVGVFSPAIAAAIKLCWTFGKHLLKQR